ncbi:MAG: GNAT family N-acetyltransferase [Sporolactobacillus sp.]
MDRRTGSSVDFYVTQPCRQKRCILSLLRINYRKRQQQRTTERNEGRQMEILDEKNRFCLLAENGGEIGEVSYWVDKAQTVHITHTSVDPRYRGQGLASQLMKAMAARARAEQWTVQADCSYAALYFAKNKESYQDILKNE